MEIRSYAPADREGCLAVFDSNVPPAADRAGFLEFTADGAAKFYVAEHEGEIVGCGGFTVTGATARLHWGMVHAQRQRQGVGRFLLFYRLREITRDGAVQMVELSTPRQFVAFFASQGFREVSGGPNVAIMTKRLIVCA